MARLIWKVLKSVSLNAAGPRKVSPRICPSIRKITKDRELRKFCSAFALKNQKQVARIAFISFSFRKTLLESRHVSRLIWDSRDWQGLVYWETSDSVVGRCSMLRSGYSHPPKVRENLMILSKMINAMKLLKDRLRCFKQWLSFKFYKSNHKTSSFVIASLSSSSEWRRRILSLLRHHSLYFFLSWSFLVALRPAQSPRTFLSDDLHSKEPPGRRGSRWTWGPMRFRADTLWTSSDRRASSCQFRRKTLPKSGRRSRWQNRTGLDRECMLR